MAAIVSVQGIENAKTFGACAKRIRLKDPREINTIRLADYLGISATRLCDIEAGRRAPMDMEKLGMFCNFFHLDARIRSRLYELADEARYSIPMFVGGDSTRYNEINLSGIALRVSNWGNPEEESWKKIIREAEKAGMPLSAVSKEDLDALLTIKGITGRGGNAEVHEKDGHLTVYEVRKKRAV